MHQLPIESHDSHRSQFDTDTHQKKNQTESPLGHSLVQKIANQLAGRIGNHRYDMWFRDANFAIDQNRVEVSAANSFIARWIESNFTDDIRTAAAAALGRDATDADVRVEVIHAQTNGRTNDHTPAGNRPGGDAAVVTAERNGRAAHHDPAIRSARHEHRPPRRFAAPRLRRLDEFVVSDTNRVAHGAARQLAEARNGAHHSPLFIHGPCGVGKTHLLQGATRHYADIWGSSPGAVRYVTAEQFTNEYITAIRSGRIDEFRRRMRRLELLAIDDVHFLSNKERTQVEFLHTFDEINMSGARVIIASDSHPRQLRRLNKALVSRMLSGMIVQIELPDLDLRRRLARKLAADRGLNISEQAMEVIASECTGSIRELEGAINKLLALAASIRQHSTINGKPDAGNGTIRPNEPIGLLMVQQLFGDSTNATSSPVRIATIIDVVCERLNVTRSELMASGRHKRVVLARSLIAYLSKKMTTHSFPEIAGALGRRNHSTVHNANRRMAEQLEANASVDLVAGDGSILLADLVNQLRQRITRRHRE